MGNPVCGGCGCRLDTDAASSTWGVGAGPAQGEVDESLRLCGRCTACIARALWPELVELVVPAAGDRADAVAIVGVIHQVVAFFGYDQLSASRWFSSPVIGLGGQHPKDLVQSKAGRQEILVLLGKLAHGVPP
ncbi:hypothetical protein Pres01_47930 [Metapseudomonas resinovorans]|uniref:MbcA/ParS/Xre antitoxin family protein n=1 Tax=Metapseudomonas resinovorans TaxID=53412 RepID=UPI000986C113|nr:hypothetical protein Pres01_47930 [Pseudomonas resinovorans]